MLCGLIVLRGTQKIGHMAVRVEFVCVDCWFNFFFNREDTFNVEQEKEMTDEALGSRRNIYDGDEFDAFSQTTMDWSRVYKGKRSTKSFHFTCL